MVERKHRSKRTNVGAERVVADRVSGSYGRRVPETCVLYLSKHAHFVGKNDGKTCRNTLRSDAFIMRPALLSGLANLCEVDTNSTGHFERRDDQNIAGVLTDVFLDSIELRVWSIIPPQKALECPTQLACCGKNAC